MEELQKVIFENTKYNSNCEWGTILNKAINDYLGDMNEIYVKNNDLFIYWYEENIFEKISSLKRLFENLKQAYEDEGRTKYQGDKLRKYVVLEIYNLLNDNDNKVNDLIELLKELSE